MQTDKSPNLLLFKAILRLNLVIIAYKISVIELFPPLYSPRTPGVNSIEHYVPTKRNCNRSFWSPEARLFPAETLKAKTLWLILKNTSKIE